MMARAVGVEMVIEYILDTEDRGESESRTVITTV
jgi:hypothetical protein